MVSLGTGLGTEYERSNGAGWFWQRVKKIMGLPTARNGTTVDQTRSWCHSAGINFQRFAHVKVIIFMHTTLQHGCMSAVVNGKDYDVCDLCHLNFPYKRHFRES